MMRKTLHLQVGFQFCKMFPMPNSINMLAEAKSIRNELVWMIQHIDNIGETEEGAKQISYIREKHKRVSSSIGAM